LIDVKHHHRKKKSIINVYKNKIKYVKERRILNDNIMMKRNDDENDLNIN